MMLSVKRHREEPELLLSAALCLCVHSSAASGVGWVVPSGDNAIRDMGVLAHVCCDGFIDLFILMPPTRARRRVTECAFCDSWSAGASGAGFS
jgi:hypothetical protein